mmetsp:Transcript_13904/g.39915  ORF Transcript_13904/g.39915 Transcript_13904/m.39915 type:complete len:253 (+) Transcript_13904:193-951(+)
MALPPQLTTSSPSGAQGHGCGVNVTFRSEKNDASADGSRPRCSRTALAWSRDGPSASILFKVSMRAPGCIAAKIAQMRSSRVGPSRVSVDRWPMTSLKLLTKTFMWPPSSALVRKSHHCSSRMLPHSKRQSPQRLSACRSLITAASSTSSAVPTTARLSISSNPRALQPNVAAIWSGTFPTPLPISSAVSLSVIPSSFATFSVAPVRIRPYCARPWPSALTDPGPLPARTPDPSSMSSRVCPVLSWAAWKQE